MELTLIRTYFPWGTNGILWNKASCLWVCQTIELPWIDNKPRVSCIPEGRYELKMRYSKKFGQHIHIQDVMGRSLILIHPANDAAKELRGCIAPVTYVTGQGKGLASVKAFNILKRLVKPVIETEPVYLTIKSQRS